MPRQNAYLQRNGAVYVRQIEGEGGESAVDDRLTSTAIVANNDSANDQFHFEAFNLSDGSRAWRNSQPSDDAQDVALGYDQTYGFGVGWDGNLYKFKTSDGSAVWSVNIGTNNFYTVTTDKTRVYLGDDNGNLYARKQSDGSPIWSDTSTLGRLTSRGNIAADRSGTVYVGDADGGGNLFAFDASDGTKKWESDPGYNVDDPGRISGVAVSPDNNTILIGFDHTFNKAVWAFGYDTGGTKLWEQNSDKSISLIARDVAIGPNSKYGYLVAASGQTEGYTAKIQLSDGALQWSDFQTDNHRAIGVIVGPAGDAVYQSRRKQTSAGEGILIAYDVSGNLLWTHQAATSHEYMGMDGANRLDAV